MQGKSLALLAGLGLVFSAPVMAQTRSFAALPVMAQGAVPADCLFRPDLEAHKGRDRDANGVLDDCGANAASADKAQYAKAASGLGVSPGLLVGILALLAAVFAAAGGGSGGGNDSPG